MKTYYSKMSLNAKSKHRYKHKGITVHTVGIFLLFVVFFLPDYFGVYLGSLPSLSVKRLVLIFLCLFIYHSTKKRKQFLNEIYKFKFKWLFLFYIFVLFYTAILRGSINTLFQPTIDHILLFFTMLYLFKYEIDKKEFFEILKKITFILCIFGIIEYMIGFSLFSKLETIPGILRTDIRNGELRINGPCRNPLAYGLYLNMLLPIIAFDYKKNQINIMKNKIIILLIIVNVFLINSRLVLGILIIEVFLLIIFSPKKIRSNSFLMLIALLIFLVIIIVIFNDSKFSQSILKAVANIYDTLFGTKYAVKLGADDISDSTYYRTLLPKIFKLDWLNPLLGRGFSYKISLVMDGYWIQSVDNFYVNQYILLAYPGLIGILLIIISFIKIVIKKAFKQKSSLYKTFFVLTICYFISLWWVDHLATLTYIYVIFAFIYANKDNKLNN